MRMGNTFTVRLPEDPARWLRQTARETGVTQGRIIREQLDKAREKSQRPFLQLAGKAAGPADLSSRKGFSGK
jgi:hypothetical protein